MKYVIRGYIFQNGNPVRIPDGKFIVENWEDAEKGVSSISPYYLFTLDKLPEVKED